MSAGSEIARKLAEQMDAHGTRPTDLARAFNVKVPSIYGWLKTGRIGKDRLKGLAAYFGTSVAYWHGADEEEESLAPDERRLLAVFRRLDGPFRGRLIDDAEHLARLQGSDGQRPLAPPEPSRPRRKPPTPKT